MSDTTPSVAEIQAKDASRLAMLSQLEQEAVELSLEAVAGYDEAISALTEINSRISNLTLDGVVLDRARLAAETLEQRRADEVETQERAEAFAQARLHATAIVALAGRLDEIRTDIQMTRRRISETEKVIHASLRRAGQPVDGGRIGQVNLAGIAQRILAGTYDDPDKTVDDVASGAWKHLLKQREEGDSI